MGGPKRALAALALLLLILAGCGGVTTLNATGYVQGLLDSTYKGNHAETYLALVGLTEEEAEQDYSLGLYAEYKRFADRFGLDKYALSGTTRDEVIDCLGAIYATARYDVRYATRSESGAWLVEVQVQPIRTLAVLLEEELPDLRARFDADETIGEDGRAEAWAAAVLELCRGAAAEYGEPVTIAVRLVPDEDDFYCIGAQDFYNLDALILTYED